MGAPSQLAPTPGRNRMPTTDKDGVGNKNRGRVNCPARNLVLCFVVVLPTAIEGGSPRCKMISARPSGAILCCAQTSSFEDSSDQKHSTYRLIGLLGAYCR